MSTMTFQDVDPKTGRPTPTTYESMRASLLDAHPIPDDLPESISARLVVAVDFIALAYEEANGERWALFGPLMDSAVTSALLTFELALKHHLRHPPDTRLTLGPLIEQGKAAAVLPRSTEHDQLWEQLGRDRNDLVHGNPGAPRYGVTAAPVVGAIIDTIGVMRSVLFDETVPDTTA